MPAFESNLNGNENSVLDYYKKLSNNTFNLNSATAKNGGNVFFYKEPNPRNYYKVKTTDNTIGYVDTSQNRAKRELELLEGALNATETYFSLVTGDTMDINSDDFADSITFVINGSPEGWSDLLWPHMWDMYSVNSYSGNDPDYDFIEINGKKIYKYTFQLSNWMTTGVLCHELSHVLGAPDLYDYNY